MKINPYNAQSAMPIMPRTALLDIYMQLPTQDKIAFKSSISKYGNFLTKYITDNESNKSAILAIEEDDITENPNSNRIRSVTYQDWVDSLPSPTAAKEDITEDAIGETINTAVCKLSDYSEDGTNALGKFDIERSTQIYDKEEPDAESPPKPLLENTDKTHSIKKHEIEGIILELRGLERNVTPDNWKYVARDVAILVRETNKMKEPYVPNIAQVQKSYHNRNKSATVNTGNKIVSPITNVAPTRLDIIRRNASNNSAASGRGTLVSNVSNNTTAPRVDAPIRSNNTTNASTNHRGRRLRPIEPNNTQANGLAANFAHRQTEERKLPLEERKGTTQEQEYTSNYHPPHYFSGFSRNNFRAVALHNNVHSQFNGTALHTNSHNASYIHSYNGGRGRGRGRRRGRGHGRGFLY